ncbi:periphilin-1 isoform X2 [Anas acuta]|uniref:periphilin-1 isoform X2 n=1 Tax=Anas acuta TaxID=28680 RepID=UPI000A3821D0|nr:periphilin-1 isoform X2 [Anas platyrhynchos]|eukprot:XP_027312826.1 periphilin-1 isoform X2 [Anas platyrhynchos]
MAYRRDEMWSEGRYDYERIPRERLPPRIHPDDDYHRVVNIVPKKPPLLDRPGEGSYSRYDDYGHVEYRDYEEGRSFAHERRSGPPHRGVHKDESGYRWPRDDHSISRQPEYRDVRDSFRRKSFYPSHYMRERSPHKRDSPFFRESPVSRRDSPHSRSGSSVSSRSYSPERSKAYPFHQSQHSRSMSSLHKRNISSQQGKERTSVQTLKTSRDASPSGSTAVPSSKALDKSNRLSEKELAEAASKWAAEKAEKADESSLPERTEYDAGSSAPMYVEQTEETETNITDNTELYEDGQLLCRSKAIATKTKEIEQVAPLDDFWKVLGVTGLSDADIPSVSLMGSSSRAEMLQPCSTIALLQARNEETGSPCS